MTQANRGFCKRGHDLSNPDSRYQSNNGCKQCQDEASRKRRGTINPRQKGYCLRGHDLSIPNAKRGHQCRLCKHKWEQGKERKAKKAQYCRTDSYRENKAIYRRVGTAKVSSEIRDLVLLSIEIDKTVTQLTRRLFDA